jgi:hypothetical protein
MLRGQAEPGRRAVIEDVDDIAIEADDLGEAVDLFRDSVEGAAPSGMSDLPKPGRSGAIIWKRSAKSGMRSRNM